MHLPLLQPEQMPAQRRNSLRNQNPLPLLIQQNIQQPLQNADHAPLAQALIQAQRHNAIQRIQRFIRRQQQRPIQAVGNLNMQQPPDQAIQIPQLQVNQIQAPQVNNQQRHQLRQENEHRNHFDLMGAEDIFEEPIIQNQTQAIRIQSFFRGYRTRQQNAQRQNQIAAQQYINVPLLQQPAPQFNQHNLAQDMHLPLLQPEQMPAQRRNSQGKQKRYIVPLISPDFREHQRNQANIPNPPTNRGGGGLLRNFTPEYENWINQHQNLLITLPPDNQFIGNNQYTVWRDNFIQWRGKVKIQLQRKDNIKNASDSSGVTASLTDSASVDINVFRHRMLGQQVQRNNIEADSDSGVTASPTHYSGDTNGNRDEFMNRMLGQQAQDRPLLLQRRHSSEDNHHGNI